LTWLVIVNNGNACLGVLSNKFLVGIWVVELNKEVLIWLPVIIIVDLNIDGFGGLAFSKLNNTIKSTVIISSLGITINGASTYVTSSFLFICNNNSELS